MTRAPWERVFRRARGEWFEAPASAAMELAAEWVRSIRPRALLDLGSGFGRWAVHLAADSRVTAVDQAWAGGMVGRQLAQAEDVSPSFVTAEGVALPFADRQFDAVVITMVLEELDPSCRTAVLQEVTRVCRRRAAGFLLLNRGPQPGVKTLSGGGRPLADGDLAELLLPWKIVWRGEVDDELRAYVVERSSGGASEPKVMKSIVG